MTEISLSFSQEAQEELPLRQAAYRMTGTAACQIDIMDGRWVCRLTASDLEKSNRESLEQQFLAILNDENLREQIERRTSPLRDVIVALAFGTLVREDNTPH